jgi:hypothetical protein
VFAGGAPLAAQASAKAKPRAQTPASTQDTAAQETTPAADDAPQDRSADRVEAARDASLRAAPDGAPIATVQRGARARVLGRANGWARVQVEGWVPEGDIRPDAGVALSGVTAAEVRADPNHYVGQTVDWRLQLIAVQTADELRPEMMTGQPYLLMRGPLPEAGFVYVTLSPAEADKMWALPPLQEMMLRVTIRVVRTRYLETPVVDLVTVVSGGKEGPR